MAAQWAMCVHTMTGARQLDYGGELWASEGSEEVVRAYVRMVGPCMYATERLLALSEQLF